MHKEANLTEHKGGGGGRSTTHQSTHQIKLPKIKNSCIPDIRQAPQMTILERITDSLVHIVYVVLDERVWGSGEDGEFTAEVVALLGGYLRCLGVVSGVWWGAREGGRTAGKEVALLLISWNNSATSLMESASSLFKSNWSNSSRTCKFDRHKTIDFNMVNAYLSEMVGG